MSSSSGIRISNDKLEPLRPVLQAWIDNVIQYVELFDGHDLPYWYNERANVGVLSAAAWKAGFVSLEEFQSNKFAIASAPADTSCSSAKESPRTKKGRCDLYIADANKEFFIEAKVSYPSIHNLAKCFDAGMAKIAKDKRNVGDKDSYHLSALFCAPYAADVQAPETTIAQHLALAQAHPVDAHAWVQPKQAQATPSHNGCFYPLVSLFIKLVHAAETDSMPA